MKYTEIIDLIKHDELKDHADKRFENMLDYDEQYQVWYDKKYDKYYFVSAENYSLNPNSTEACCEVYLVAELSYKADMLLTPDEQDLLEDMFPCICCGEAFTCYGGAFRWFNDEPCDTISIPFPIK